MTAGIPTRQAVAVLSAANIPGKYRGREYWERRFVRLGNWPEMLAYDSVSRRYSTEIDKRFLDFQLLAISQTKPHTVMGIAHSVPLHVGTDIDHLPATGWDWALAKAVTDHISHVAPDCLCGLSVTVLPRFQRRGIGRRLIEEMLLLASRRQLRTVVMPVRPIMKENYPCLSMSDFLNWQRNDGYHQDPWIRAHQRAGGEVQGICKRSMTVRVPLAKWERWCGRKFSRTGYYVVRGGLVPAKIDAVNRIGLYREPNIWIVYSSSPT